MKVRKKMIQGLVAIDSSATAEVVAKKMDEGNVGTVLVMDQGKLSGLATDRQIAVNVVAAGKDLSKHKLNDFMTQDLVTSSPDMDICQAARRMGEFGFRRMPVVEGDKPIGIISVADIAEHAKGCNLCTECALEEISKSVR